jgi:hypothetical protein
MKTKTREKIHNVIEIYKKMYLNGWIKW